MIAVRDVSPGKRSLLSRTIAGTLVCAMCFLLTPAASRADDDWPWQANSAVVEAGDWLQLILPGIALFSTLLIGDWEGTWQFGKAAAVDIASTHALKMIIGSMRPDDSTPNSFPSGHTNAAFLGASFVHFRYGWLYALPMYAAAVFVGYSRIYANRHWADDVFAGAALAVLSTWVFTSRYKDKIEIKPLVTRYNPAYGVQLAIKW